MMKHLRLILWLSLVANVLLLVCLTWLMSKPITKQSLGSDTASALQMKAGYENGPIILLLDKEFDQNASFTVFDRDQELMIAKNDALSSHGTGTKRAGISLGTELELACYYVYDPNPSFLQFQLMMGDQIFDDLNADGQYDLRTWMRPAKMSNGRTAIDVWFNDEWQEVIGGAGVEYRSINTLKDGLKVKFEQTSGRWLPLAPSDSK